MHTENEDMMWQTDLKGGGLLAPASEKDHGKVRIYKQRLQLNSACKTINPMKIYPTISLFVHLHVYPSFLLLLATVDLK